MKITRYKEKDAVTLILAKQEAWDLMMVCHSATVYHKQEMAQYKKNSEPYKHHRDLLDKSSYFDRLLSIARVTSETEVVEV